MKPPSCPGPLAEIEARDRDLLADKDAGLSNSVLAEKYGISLSRVCQIARRRELARQEEARDA